MDRLMIEGRGRLEGRLVASGSKNAVLPLMAAALLTDEPLILHRTPDLRDVSTLALILERLGVTAQRDGETLVLQGQSDGETRAPYDLVSTMRASICVLGPLIARRGRAAVSMPGGCVFGVRPVDQHVHGLNALGAKLTIDGGYLVSDIGARLQGADVYLGTTFGPSVLATANTLMASVLARGKTRIMNVAMEPEVVELIDCLLAMGARISGKGGHLLEVEGVDRLHGAEVSVGGDRIEAGTFLIGAAGTRGDVTVEGIKPPALASLVETLRRMGAEVTQGEDWIRVAAHKRLTSADVTTLPFPGFATDLQAQVMALMTLSQGISVVTERVFPDRFMHVAELLRLGAQIRKEGAQAIIEGTDRLSGAVVMASDLRASAALVLAGLFAEGQTEVRRVYHLDRGYHQIDRRLGTLGANIRREAQPRLEKSHKEW